MPVIGDKNGALNSNACFFAIDGIAGFGLAWDSSYGRHLRRDVLGS